LLEAFRLSWGLPFSPNSFYRCDAHNRSLPNSSKYSMHCQGGATDIPLPKSDQARFIRLARSIFPFVYLGENFIHCGLWNQ